MNKAQEEYGVEREAESLAATFAAYMQHIEFKKILKLTIHF